MTLRRYRVPDAVQRATLLRRAGTHAVGPGVAAHHDASASRCAASGARETGSAALRHDSLRLLRSLRCSSASNRAIDSKCSSRPSRWCRASLASSAAVSAIKAAASSGLPSPAGSSFRDCRSLREAVRFRPPPVLVKKPASKFTYMAANTPVPAATLGRISQLFGYESVISEPLFNICRFDRGPLNTHVRPETVACESRRANLRFFP